MFLPGISPFLYNKEKIKEAQRMAQTVKENKMGAMPVPKLLLNLGIPMMLSMLVQALYNMVDTFFVSHIPDTAQVAEMGDKAINALTLAYPVQQMMIALMVGIGIATNTLLAQSLGRRDRERASRVAGNAVFLTICIFAVCFLFGAFAAGAFIGSQTDDPVVAKLGTTYLRIVCLGSLGTIGHMGMEKVVMGCGKTRATMVAQMAGALTNIILDPIMIFGLLGLPAMGVAGAAWATVIGQFVSLFVILYVRYFKLPEVDGALRYWKPDRGILKEFFSIGVPAAVMQVLLPIMSYGINLIFGRISAHVVTAYGVYYKMQYFVYMAVYGLNNASISATAFNFGAGNKARVSQTIKYAVLYACIITLLGTGVVQLFAQPLVGLFSVSGETARLCVTALHIASLGFVFGGAAIILPGVCQALGNGVYSLISSLLRYIVVLLPLAFVFSLTASAASTVWWSIAIAETVACAVSAVLTRRLYQNRVGSMKQ